MKTRIKIILIAIFCLFTYKANARIPILYGLGDKVSLVKVLPQDEMFTIQGSDGKEYHANLGVMYEQFSLFYIPIYNFGTYKYVLYTDNKIDKFDITYVDLSRDDIAVLQSKFVGIPDKPELPFWDSVGGKLLIACILLFVFISRNDE